MNFKFEELTNYKTEKGFLNNYNKNFIYQDKDYYNPKTKKFISKNRALAYIRQNQNNFEIFNEYDINFIVPKKNYLNVAFPA